ncbi:MAG TPA: (Fe-S)-binding protein [Tepidisphaeraceae bacterium]|jgi:L-lactate dehydrogenase complex protein LldE
MAHRVALFITCLTDQFYPSVGVAVTKILERYGCRVDFPQAQTCCGQPFYNNGFHKEAADLGRQFIDTFSGYDYVVTPSGSCCAMVREQYHELFHHDPVLGPKMEAVRGRTFEFVEFLTKVLKVDVKGLTLPKPETITYHYTCHQRGLGMKDEAVQLLKKIDGVHFVPMEKTDQCCGFGGTFAIKYPSISEAIVDDKVRCIEATAAQTTICNDAGCTMNIAGMCHRKGVNTNVRHIAEVMADAMGIDVTKF